MQNIANLQSELEQYQFLNGLFPAAVGSKNRLMNVLCWIRDNYYAYLALNPVSKLKIGKTFQKIIDLDIKAGKFNLPPSEDKKHLHPVRKRNLAELGREWAFIQNDAVGNLLEVMVDLKDEYRASKIVKYLDMIEFWKCFCSGFWEAEKDIRSSSLASCIRGLESYQKTFVDTNNLREMINAGYETLLSLLPNETPTRKSDLALLSVIYPGKLDHKRITPDLKQKIIENVKPLIGEYGVKRFLGDKWDGKAWTLEKGREMQWTLGLPWLYLCTGDLKYLEKARELKKKYGTLFEGFINGEPNCTPLLIWAEVMYILAKIKYAKDYCPSCK